MHLFAVLCCKMVNSACAGDGELHLTSATRPSADSV